MCSSRKKPKRKPRYKLYALALFLSLALNSHPVNAIEGETNGHAFESVTVTTSAVKTLTSGNYVARSAFGSRGGGTVALFCTVETDSIRFTYDGTTVTRSLGHPVSASTSTFASFVVYGYDNVRSLKMIGAGTTSAVVQCTFEKDNQK